MSDLPSSRDIQRWYPRRWREIAGNSEMIQTWWDFIQYGGCNMLFTGPSRTGKTRTVALGIMSLLCPNRTHDLDPCGTCPSCRGVYEARDSHTGMFSAIAGSSHSFIPIDCENVTPEELRKYLQASDLESVRTVIYLDEVAALGRRGLEAILLKPIDESPCIWIASAITVTKPDEKGKRRRTEGLSRPMRGRFAIKVGTALPATAELTNWIRERCREWQIDIEQERDTIPLLIKRTGHQVGYVIHVLAAAASRGRKLTPDQVRGFNFDALD